MLFSDYIVYADESGDHSLTSIDPEYPIFVLDLCIFHKETYVKDIVPAIQRFKFRHFGHDTVLLHEREIRKQKPPFKFLQIETKRRVFVNELSDIIEAADFKIVRSVIDKNKFVARHGEPTNPYAIALKSCMEDCHSFLKERGQLTHRTHLVFECRGQKEDNELELEFRRICDIENRFGNMPELEIVFADKRRNSAGLQLADLTARPIGLHTLRPNQANRAYEIISSKFYTGSESTHSPNGS